MIRSLAAVALFLCVLAVTPAQSEEPQPASELPILIVGSGGYSWVIEDADGRPVLYTFSQVVVLGKSGPKPPPDVVPSEFGLETQAKQWMLTVPVADKANRVEISKAMTDNAALAKSGKFSTLGEMEAALGVMLGGAIKNKPAWAAFGASLQAAVSTLKSPAVGKIRTPDDLARALTEIVKGMVP